MTPKDKDQRSAGELEEDNCTKRKRSRRVSFAETTVHVFKRDEESDSPANSTPVLSEGCRVSDNEESVGFGGIQSQGDDSVESAPEDESDDAVRLRFVRDIDLSSPGITVGSVTSNEDDNFFGPVSTSFINSGRLSESGMADDNNHDITLDSTAFSLHFRNIAPPDDQSANSVGSLRTPTVETPPCIPMGFLVGRDQTEELSNKCSVRQTSNVSGDWDKINLVVGGSLSYGKLSLTLGALMDEVNLRMQHNSPIIDHRFITSTCRTDEVEGIRNPLQDGEQFGNPNSCDDDPGSIMHSSVSPMGHSVSNESLLHAKAKALTNYQNGEKIKEMLSPGKGHDLAHSNLIVNNGQNSKLLSPSHGEFQNDLNGQACHVHEDLFSSIRREGKSYQDSFIDSSSSFQSISGDAEEKLKPERQRIISRTVQPSSELMHDAIRRQSASLRRELMEHGEKMSAYKNQTTISNIKSRMQSEYGPIPLDSSSVNLGATEVNCAKHTEGMGIIRDLNCSGNICNPTILDKNAVLESMDISMETPNNVVKAFQFSTLKGSISSYQDKQRQLQYRSVIPRSESLHSSSRDLSASLKMELRDHGERISAIKSSLTRSRFKSKMQTDCEAAPLMKDIFITNLQGSLNEINDGLHLKHAGNSDVNIDANEVTAAKPLEGLHIVKDLDCSRNCSYLTQLEKNVAFSESVEKGKSEKCVEFFCHSSPKLPHTIGPCAFSSGQREADLKESNKDISSNDALANKDKSAVSLEGFVTSEADEISRLRDMHEHKILQPTTSLVSHPVEKVSDGEKLKISESLGTLVHHEKTGIEMKNFSVGGSYFSKKINENSANRPKKVFERPMVDLYEASGEVLGANTTFSKSFESSAAKIVQFSDNHCFNKMDPKKSQATVSYFNGLQHQNRVSQQETYFGNDVAVIGEIENEQKSHTQIAGYSEGYMMQNCPVTVPEVITDFSILPADHMHHDKALDITANAPLKLWTDVHSKLSDAANQLLPQSASGLNLQKLDDMENLLDELQATRKYEELCISLRNKTSSSNPHQKRVIDARFLLEMLGIAKARKQLNYTKLKELRSKAQILHSQVEECGKLKSVYAQLCNLYTRVVESDESSHCRHWVHDMKLEEQNRLMAMKQELGILEQNIKLLLNSLEASCKLTGKMSCDDVIKTVDEHVMRRAFCKEIQQHVHLGKLCDVIMENDHYEIIFGYCNQVFQRFTISKSRFSGVVADISSNAANILKKYPNMNACTAYEFVFKINIDQKLANSTCVYERTVEANLLMGTLIDVLEEILLSRLEVFNLIFSTFLKQPSGELELQLCFYSSRGSRKLILGIGECPAGNGE
ncbi:uncharacterized protein LOC110038514 [Phalaenopsis equestris]|uniref:uncharacterized protein LOC110038514 n=1 Tax=Phalaenopsis equestris TaxID=78828 RepID=UPI0009E2FCEA|nr:uncharacterized protein LOC110038514 [Phalaenopsis equestris]